MPGRYLLARYVGHDRYPATGALLLGTREENVVKMKTILDQARTSWFDVGLRYSMIFIGLAAALIALALPSAQAEPSRSYTARILASPHPQADARFGYQVAAAGDLNHDGIPDVLVSAAGQDVGQNENQGQVYAFSGSDGGLLGVFDDPDPQPDAWFGIAVLGVDLTLDGSPEVLASALTDVRENVRQGQVYVFDGVDNSVVTTLENPTARPYGYFGMAIALAGDLNNDRVPELIVGAPFQGLRPEVSTGQAIVIDGADQTSLLVLDLPRSACTDQAEFGISATTVGDVDGDGVPDMVIGSPARFENELGPCNPDQAFVMSGHDGRQLLGELNSIGKKMDFGFGVSGIGDFDGDDVPDVLVAAPKHRYVVDGGSVFAFSGATGELIRSFDNPRPQPDAYFGGAMVGIDDVNGDGVRDVLIGAPYQDVDSFPNQGIAWVLSGTDSSVLAQLNSPIQQPNSNFGSAVASIGDVNDDGIPDLAVGAPLHFVGNSFKQGIAYLFISDSPTLTVRLDIRPGDLSAQINPRSRGVIPVGILGSDTLDVADIDVTTLAFGPNEAAAAHRHGHREDVNYDGIMDLMLHFRTQDTGIACGDESAMLTGETLDGQPIEGSDSIQTVGCRVTRRPAIWMKDQDTPDSDHPNGPVNIERKK
jgi:hypothetical protein